MPSLHFYLHNSPLSANRWDPNWLRSYSACLDSKQEVFPRVVTGATSGIGKAYAHELARRGLNVVLISRSLERLRQVAAEIEQKHGRSTKVIQTDFTEGSEIYAPIQAALQGLEIGLLVNNVGMIQEKFDGFLNIPDVGKHINDIVNCNLLSTVKMTELILPQMLARRKGIIINMSSTSARRPFPPITMYCGTKVAIDFFSRALDMEYGSKGIIVQCVRPMLVDTNMTGWYKSKYTKFFMKPAEAYAREALNTVGLAKKTAGCLSHSIQFLLYRWLLPEKFQFTTDEFTSLLHALKKLERCKKTLPLADTAETSLAGEKQDF
ncbi:very-long-chain 3-oxoacyl-CoA reductase-like isoform X2 [Varanus komodoensis]|uniref:very-long-chain 3-oxoacyl-CoA reductase-like isoform X2 n=1 Tax=Varanus komodoensis TaxID=61221 RepID=UPI001CF76C28|nr:very-long-chain 3-oxoacyl-CoA reductase-like isoform X2 [Varanus komodoensis]XP_044290969.1 very-long-chain 3-oxoacyl-CoA reductase-like isoform X2 [Varanus komodoensis]XP_044290970.1 very-long-chain 3-oxoacyl-CoA reductase-like isoform X2 [Varanus komodoensis]